jgi:hypothetical protein
LVVVVAQRELAVGTVVDMKVHTAAVLVVKTR